MQRSILLALALPLAAASCRDPVSPSPAPADSVSELAPAGSPYPGAAEIEWTGDLHAGPTEHPSALAAVANDDVVTVEAGKDRQFSTVQRVRAQREVVWEHRLVESFGTDAAVAVDPGKGLVVVAQYSAIDSGAKIHALDLATGKERWAQAVIGLGPIPHSQYYSEVALKIVRGAVVVFGNEASGRYIEVMDPESGKTLSHRKL